MKLKKSRCVGKQIKNIFCCWCCVLSRWLLFAEFCYLHVQVPSHLINIFCCCFRVHYTRCECLWIAIELRVLCYRWSCGLVMIESLCVCVFNCSFSPLIISFLLCKLWWWLPLWSCPSFIVLTIGSRIVFQSSQTTKKTSFRFVQIFSLINFYN